MKYKDLSEANKKKIFADWKLFIKDKSLDCNIHCKAVEVFWENHKEMDYSDMLGGLK